MSNYLIVLTIGFIAQGFFSARILIQWILTERAKKVVSPSLYWILSIAGSYLFCLYGWLRNDFAIVLGQFISYYIYLWNLQEKGVWTKIYQPVRIILMLTPVAALCFMLHDVGSFADSFLKNNDIPLWLILYGSAGQVLFTLRFVYQWFYSYKRRTSLLPAGFWIISLAGSLLIVTYGILRFDIVLIVGQSFGLVAYSRNLWIGHTSNARGL